MPEKLESKSPSKIEGSPPDSVLEGSSSEHNYLTGDAFAHGARAELYEPIPEYEGRHRYDPSAEWTEKEEKRLVRRVSKEYDKQVNHWTGQPANPPITCKA